MAGASRDPAMERMERAPVRWGRTRVRALKRHVSLLGRLVRKLLGSGCRTLTAALQLPLATVAALSLRRVLQQRSGRYAAQPQRRVLQRMGRGAGKVALACLWSCGRDFLHR